jgi:hypothetical protein
MPIYLQLKVTYIDLLLLRITKQHFIILLHVPHYPYIMIIIL